MAATTPVRGDVRSRAVTRSTETRSAPRTTEFYAFVAMTIGVLVAGAVVKGGNDRFTADEVWLYITMLTIGYMVSRGLAKCGSREPYTAGDRPDPPGRDGI
jgi:hypothetical protein